MGHLESTLTCKKTKTPKNYNNVWPGQHSQMNHVNDHSIQVDDLVILVEVTKYLIFFQLIRYPTLRL